MEKMPYEEQLKQPQWKRKRTIILKRDNKTCQLCGDSETDLHVHHKYYKKSKRAWEYPDVALVTLCKHCHFEVERMKPMSDGVGYRDVQMQKYITDIFRIMLMRYHCISYIRIYNLQDEYLDDYFFTDENIKNLLSFTTILQNFIDNGE